MECYPTKPCFCVYDLVVSTYEGSSGDPASLHKYLYVNGNPVVGRDPSGHFTLAEEEVAVDVSSTLDEMGMPALRKALSAKVVDIYACGGFQAYIVPVHFWIYAKQPVLGLRYDIGVAKLDAGVLLGTPGTLKVSQASLAEGTRGANIISRKVASLSEIQFVLWNAFVVADAELISLGETEAVYGLEYSIFNADIPIFARQMPDVVNCLTFTTLASTEAAIMSKR